MTATMNDLEIKLCEHDNEFAHIAIKGKFCFVLHGFTLDMLSSALISLSHHPVGIQGRVIMKQNWTIVQARLTDVEIQDLTENTLYPKVKLHFHMSQGTTLSSVSLL